MIPILDTNELNTGFQDYFQPILATSNEMFAEVHRLRYQVYCREFRFEKEEDCPNQQESDGYDRHSLHCVLLHVPTRKIAGSVRLILPDPEAKHTRLPFEKFCGHSLDRTIIDPVKLPANGYGEISRLAVAAEFRRRRGEDDSPIGNLDKRPTESAEKRYFPLIPMGLYVSAAAVGLLLDLVGVFAMMEPRLARHLTYFGINPVRAGKVVDYHGPRAPFYISRQSLLTGLRPEARFLLNKVKLDLEPSVRHSRLVHQFRHRKP